MFEPSQDPTGGGRNRCQDFLHQPRMFLFVGFRQFRKFSVKKGILCKKKRKKETFLKVLVQVGLKPGKGQTKPRYLAYGPVWCTWKAKNIIFLRQIDEVCRFYGKFQKITSLLQF